MAIPLTAKVMGFAHHFASDRTVISGSPNRMAARATLTRLQASHEGIAASRDVGLLPVALHDGVAPC
jgi:hypothetical protein